MKIRRLVLAMTMWALASLVCDARAGLLRSAGKEIAQGSERAVSATANGGRVAGAGIATAGKAAGSALKAGATDIGRGAKAAPATVGRATQATGKRIRKTIW